MSIHRLDRDGANDSHRATGVEAQFVRSRDCGLHHGRLEVDASSEVVLAVVIVPLYERQVEPVRLKTWGSGDQRRESDPIRSCVRLSLTAALLGFGRTTPTNCPGTIAEPQAERQVLGSGSV